ncbi:MAG: hypothetical protein L0387_15935, partial [Acidobacteria bacterium]|nr:hypothetical protein [Acidobacteriota bacterium]
PEAAPMACGHNCGRDARAPRVAAPLQKMSNLQATGLRQRLAEGFDSDFDGILIVRGSSVG